MTLVSKLVKVGKGLPRARSHPTYLKPNPFPDEERDRLLTEQGLSFDLFLDEEAQTVELVELNSFGVRSPCGSCLFQWVRDRAVLYGEERHDKLEFRISF